MQLPEPDWIKISAEIIAAGSLVVGVLTYMRSVFQLKTQKRREVIRNWQRVAVYKAIAEANADSNGRSISFEDLKRKYIAATVEFRDTEIPNNEIQDSALRLSLMSLLEGKLIELLEDGTYRLSFISSWKQELERLQLTNINKARLIKVIEAKLATSSGRKQGKSELWDTLDDGEFTHHRTYLEVIREMIALGTIREQNGELCFQGYGPALTDGHQRDLEGG